MPPFLNYLEIYVVFNIFDFLYYLRNSYEIDVNISIILFVYQKALIRTFHSRFLTTHNLCKLTALKHKIPYTHHEFLTFKNH